MEIMLWIEDIVQNTTILTFFTNLEIDMVDFEDPYKVVARRNAFLAFSSA
jgi:hypothetical protein